jgi:WD40 repeat protein
VSTEIRLGDFSRDDLDVFANELNLSSANAARALDRVYHWTSGQPYLSQKLCRAIAREQIDGDIDENVDRLAMSRLGGRAVITSEPHMSHLHRAVMKDRKNFEAMLTTYGKVRKGMRVEYDPDSARHRQLLALGLLVTDANGFLRVRNRLYESVFTARWANENLPLRWRGPAVAALLVIALTAIPFTYTQLLPKPYLRVMSNPANDLETVARAHANLRSFPGHDSAADRMYRTALENRAREATAPAEIRAVSRFAMTLPDGQSLAENMQATYWDRRFSDAMREERRDDALLAALESLTVSTQVRRRRAASLVGDDYAELIGTIPAQDADGVIFNAETVQLTYHKGAEISQWSVAAGSVDPREPWTISALEVSPLLRRVIVDREGTASRIGMTINVSHPRLDDLRMRLIAPSGRTAELSFETSSSAANEQIRIPRDQLQSLVGESLSGTWSLSLRDESTGVTGHLMSWDLSLNSQVLVENFDRGLDIPDPVERPSENIWFSPDGRYAVARALQSDSARVWDLNYAQAARTIAVPASERVLGMSAGAEFLVTTSQNSVNLWRTSDGRRERSFDLGTSVLDITLSKDGEHLLTSYQSDPDTIFEVWSLATGEVAADLSIAGVPALLSIDATASHLAIADYDRAVRIWDLRQAEQIAQFDLHSQPTSIELSANGQALGIVFANSGISLWRNDRPDAPLLEETGPGNWYLAFSPSGARVLAGNRHEGVQSYRTSDGMPTGPLLDPGLDTGPGRIHAYGAAENVVVTAGAGDIARFWSMPDVSAAVTQEPVTGPPIANPWRGLQTAVATVAPGGERIAYGDRSGHVHIERVGITPTDPPADGDEISFLGHQGSVTSLVFSQDGELVASAATDGVIRIWESHSGLPRPFYGRATVSSVERMAFSPAAAKLAVLGAQRVWVMNTETGEELASIDLGEIHADLAFADNDSILLGGESGTLRSLYPDRTGNWHLRNVWQGPAPIRRIAVAKERKTIVLVDAANRLHTLDPQGGEIGADVLTIPGSVLDVAFSPDESRVLARTGRWIHWALMTPQGLLWTDTIRSPKAMSGSRMAFDSRRDSDGERGASLAGDRVLMLTRATGTAKLVELSFGYADGPALVGSRPVLLDEWTSRLRGIKQPAFIRQGL